MKELMEYQSIQAEISQIESEIDRLEAIKNSPRISHLTGLPRSGRVTDGMDIIARIDELITAYYRCLGALLALQEEAERQLAELGREERVVIRYKYVDGLRNRDIADRLNYSESTIKRRIKSAMQKQEEKNNV